MRILSPPPHPSPLRSSSSSSLAACRVRADVLAMSAEPRGNGRLLCSHASGAPTLVCWLPPCPGRATQAVCWPVNPGPAVAEGRWSCDWVLLPEASTQAPGSGAGTAGAGGSAGDSAGGGVASPAARRRLCVVMAHEQHGVVVLAAGDVNTAARSSSGSNEERPAGDAAEAPLAPPSLQVVLTRGGSGRREAGLVVSSQDCSAVSLTGRNEAYVVTAADIQEAIEEDAEEEASAEHDEELDTGNSTPAAAGQVATAGAAAPLGRLPNASDGAPTSSSSSSSSSMTSSSHSARLPLLKAASSAGLAAAAAGDADGETDTPRTSERGGGGRVSRLSAAASLTEEPAYREPVDSTRLDASHLSADGHILFCVPSRDTGLGRGKLLAFQRGVAGGISSIVPPRAATGDIIQVTSRAFPPALAVVTSGGELWTVSARVCGRWAGPMYPATFQLLPRNLDFREDESETDAVDEQGRLLSRPAAQRVNAIWEEKRRLARMRAAREQESHLAAEQVSAAGAAAGAAAAAADGRPAGAAVAGSSRAALPPEAAGAAAGSVGGARPSKRARTQDTALLAQTAPPVPLDVLQAEAEARATREAQQAADGKPGAGLAAQGGGKRPRRERACSELDVGCSTPASRAAGAAYAAAAGVGAAAGAPVAAEATALPLAGASDAPAASAEARRRAMARAAGLLLEEGEGGRRLRPRLRSLEWPGEADSLPPLASIPARAPGSEDSPARGDAVHPGASGSSSAEDEAASACLEALVAEADGDATAITGSASHAASLWCQGVPAVSSAARVSLAETTLAAILASPAALEAARRQGLALRGPGAEQPSLAKIKAAAADLAAASASAADASRSRRQRRGQAASTAAAARAPSAADEAAAIAMLSDAARTAADKARVVSEAVVWAAAASVAAVGSRVQVPSKRPMRAALAGGPSAIPWGSGPVPPTAPLPEELARAVVATSAKRWALVGEEEAEAAAAAAAAAAHAHTAATAAATTAAGSEPAAGKPGQSARPPST